MSDFDLDLDNYNLDDLLNLFKLGYDFNDKDVKRAKLIALKTHPDKCNLNPEIHMFFMKAYKSLEKIYHFKKSKQNKNTEYKNIQIENVDGGDKEILKRLNGKTVKEFNNWFNEMFEKVNKGEDSGYGDWFQSSDDVSNEKVKSMNEFGRVFDNKKREIKSLVVRKEIENFSSMGNCNNLINNKSGYSSGLFSKLQYEDLKKAHTETVVPITKEDFENKESYGNVEDLRRVRNNTINPHSREESQRILNHQLSMEENDASNLAYELLKQEEENKKRNNEWWSNLRQLIN